uniref:NADH-ubiquinone oxidoreductase chain 2 n=1 Tax=Diodora graeca TaxID=120387 RepID=A0A0X9PP92_DIOGA|nr:NADH dehydrogenase subunit 2 [Diodora graeca]
MRHMLVSDLFFVVVMLFGLVLSLSSVSWLLVWVGMEVSLIGFIPVICGNSVFGRGGTGASESAMKYFVVQAIGSSLVLVGSFAVFSVSKMWDCGVLGNSMLYLVYLGPLLVVFGFGVKLGVFPFHFWVPSVMSGMGWFGCLVLAGLQKLVPVVFLCVVVLLWTEDLIVKVLMVMSVGSSIIGGLGGINQTEVRAIMAYSSIGHMGWLLMCVCSGFMATIFYLLFYVVMSIGFFLVLWGLGCDSVGGLGVVDVGSGGFERLFVVGGILSYMGMPPFLGFGVKWFGMSCFVESASFLGSVECGAYMYFYFFLMFLGSLLSLSYYLMVFVALVMGFGGVFVKGGIGVVSYTHLRAHETDSYLVCRLLLEKKKGGVSWGSISAVSLMFMLSFLGGVMLIFSGIGV